MSEENPTPEEMEVGEADTPTFAVSDGVYNAMRFLALILLPGIATLYFALAGVLNLPAAEQVVGTITAVDAFLGLIIRSLRVTYEKSDARFDGQIDITPDPDTGNSNLNVALDPAALAGKDEVVVKVNKS